MYSSARHTWSDQFLPLVKAILGQHLIQTATWQQDTKEATDLVCDAATVAVRIRRAEYLRYADQFTVRSGSDHDSEFSKIMRGYGSHMFYGFGNISGKGPHLCGWSLLDLNAFRHHLNESRAWIRSETIRNRDGSFARSFYINSFPEWPNLVIAQGTF